MIMTRAYASGRWSVVFQVAPAEGVSGLIFPGFGVIAMDKAEISEISEILRGIGVVPGGPVFPEDALAGRILEFVGGAWPRARVELDPEGYAAFKAGHLPALGAARRVNAVNAAEARIRAAKARLAEPLASEGQEEEIGEIESDLTDPETGAPIFYQVVVRPEIPALPLMVPNPDAESGIAEIENPAIVADLAERAAAEEAIAAAEALIAALADPAS